MENISLEIKCVKIDDPDYPARMKKLPDMPEKLYYIGNLPDDNAPSMAVIGARSCSAYGRIQAFRFARDIGKMGVQIISGMALGIDSEGHKGALEAGAPTFAVLGCGADVCYPQSNRGLYQRILRNGGGIITEYEAGAPPLAWHFPARNRIISALSDVVLIVEAREKSGSLITADCALEQGRTVYAVPGAVTDSLSLGCNKLIYDGAGIAYRPEAVLAEWGLEERTKNEQKMNKNNNLALASDLKLLYSYVDSRPVSFDSIVRKSRLSPGKVSSGLIELTLMGLISEVGKHYYIRRES